jgi:hypothetical protein
MARYFFHLRQTSGNVLADVDGMDFDSPEDAITEAIATARELMADALRNDQTMRISELIVSDSGAWDRPMKTISLDISEILKRLA